MIRKFIIEKSIIYLILLCLLLTISIVATNMGSKLRYVKYLIPVIFTLILFLTRKKPSIYKVLLKNLQLFLIILLVNFIYSIITLNLSIRFVEESLLILLPIFAVIAVTVVIKTPLKKVIDTLFIIYATIFCLGNIGFFFNSNIINDFIEALKTSTLPTESWLAFPLGLFTLFYFLEKKKSRAIFALILFLLAFKRISILGFVAGLSIFWVFYKRNNNRFNSNKTVFAFVFLNIALLFLLYNFIQGDFNHYIKDLTGLSPNHFTRGRLRIYTDTVNHFDNNLLFGNSLGSTNIFLSENFEDIHFLHSDILKLIIEIGIIPFVFWLIYFFRINLVSKKVVPILVFMNFLFISDNVFLYFDTLFIFYLLIVYYKINETE